MSETVHTGGPTGHEPASPPLVTPPPVIPSVSGPSQRPDDPIDPWISIWSRPRATLRHILETDPRRGVYRLAALGGISGCLSGARQPGFGDTYPVPMVLVAALLGGVIAGVVGIQIGAALIGMTGRWLGGRGGRTEVMAALAWANVPAAWGLALWLPRAALLGGETFQALPVSLEGNPPAALLFMMLQGLEVVVALWGLVILLKCVAEAHGFTAWRAFLALVLMILVLAAPFFLIAFLGLLVR